jgi:hypothetical protein
MVNSITIGIEFTSFEARMKVNSPYTKSRPVKTFISPIPTDISFESGSYLLKNEIT